VYQEILTQDDLGGIHETAMRLLSEVGVDFPYQPAVAIFRQHGIRTERSRVHLTERQVTDALATVPATFTIAARNPQRSVDIGGGRPVLAPGYGAPFLIDLEEGKRAPTMEDYHRLVKLAHALPNMDMSGHLLVEPSGVAAGTAAARMLYAHALHSDKPFIGSTAGVAGAEQTLEIGRILFGPLDRPVTIGLINSLSPLAYSTEMLEALVTYARARQPVIIAALMMAGSTGPVTLAGVLSAQTAELLAGIVLAQIISPGTPVVFGSTSTNIDMRSGALAIGSPELSSMVVAHGQMARHFRLPCRSGGALTDASYPDAQAGFESMMSLLTTFNSGIDVVLHAGGILGSYLGFSYEKLVLDDEMCGMVRRLYTGIAVEPATLAYDVIASVGPGGNYLMEAHTVKRCRKEFWRPSLCDRSGIEAWMQAGRPTAADRARARWQALVAEHEDPSLDSTTKRQLDEFLRKHAG
jgi:trimethylamine---corrinoid protein Co-methyltransferase